MYELSFPLILLSPPTLQFTFHLLWVFASGSFFFFFFHCASSCLFECPHQDYNAQCTESLSLLDAARVRLKTEEACYVVCLEHIFFALSIWETKQTISCCLSWARIHPNRVCLNGSLLCMAAEMVENVIFVQIIIIEGIFYDIIRNFCHFDIM